METAFTGSDGFNSPDNRRSGSSTVPSLFDFGEVVNPQSEDITPGDGGDSQGEPHYEGVMLFWNQMTHRLYMNGVVAAKAADLQRPKLRDDASKGKMSRSAGSLYLISLSPNALFDNSQGESVASEKKASANF